MNSSWTRTDRIGSYTLLVAIIGLLVAVFLPELRERLGLKSQSVVNSQTQPNSSDIPEHREISTKPESTTTPTRGADAPFDIGGGNASATPRSMSDGSDQIRLRFDGLYRHINLGRRSRPAGEISPHPYSNWLRFYEDGRVLLASASFDYAEPSLISRCLNQSNSKRGECVDISIRRGNYTISVGHISFTFLPEEDAIKVDWNGEIKLDSLNLDANLPSGQVSYKNLVFDFIKVDSLE